MNPEEGVDPFDAAPGTGRAARRRPAVGSDGAAAPAVGPLGEGAFPPGAGDPAGLPDVSGSGWAWDGGALPARVPEQRDRSAPAPDPDEEPAATGPSSVVRPYVRTGGRTRAKLDLSLETLVSVLPKDVPYQLPHDEAAVLELCRHQSRSVAEVAALHRVPIGVAKVIVGDLAAAGLLAVHRSFAATGPDLALMERVLGGLRRI
jgi:hypothetical protein